MRLLETRRARPGSYPFRLTSFHTADATSYAILSHTWGDDELLYEDVVHRTGETKEGFDKVLRAIQRARDDGHRYIWIDNVCIDKSSSAELQEAINSMFAWYSKAAICYAHLSDVRKLDSGPISYKDIAASRWFERGWTLQELIAPRVIHFFTLDWTLLGDKLYLLDTLCIATHISSAVLSDVSNLNSACIAQKMSWAAGRETTRGEDRAYSLMGLFGVNMPLLYGEGAISAFLRLQEEIMRRSDDHSLFAWCDDDAPVDQVHGLLADSPDAFNYGGVDYVQQYRDRSSDEPYAMTNRGLQICLAIFPKLDEADMVYTALLDCAVEDPDRLGPEPMGLLYLIKLTPRSNTFARFRCQTSPFRGELGEGRETTEYIYVPQHATEANSKGQRQDLQFLRCLPCDSQLSKDLAPTAAPNAWLDRHELKQLRILYDDPDAQQFCGKLSGIFAVRHDLDGKRCLAFSMQKQVGKSVVNIYVGSAKAKLGFEVVPLEDALSASTATEQIQDSVGSMEESISHSRGTADTESERQEEPHPSDFMFQPFGSSVRHYDCDITVDANVSVQHGVKFYDVTTVVEPVKIPYYQQVAGADEQSPSDEGTSDQSSNEDERKAKPTSRLSLLRSKFFSH